MHVSLQQQNLLRRAVVRLCVLAALAVPAPTWAQRSDPPPDGILLGPVILAPYFESSVEHDDNVFREPGEGVSDRIENLLLGLDARVPLSNSVVELNYSANRREYADRTFDRDTVQDAGLRLELNFGSRDRLILSERYVRGISDVLAVDPGGELVFQGEPYDLNRLEFELSRNVPRLQGYSIRVARVDLNFTDAADPAPFPFFDYRGFESAFEYRHPIAPRKWIIAHYDSRRFNNYRAVDPVGVPFRKESSDSLQVGMRGFRASNRPFFFRLGYGQLRYDGVDSSEFRGVTADASWSFNVGARSRVELRAVRRPLPSNFDTYYIINEVRVILERDWLVRSKAELELLVGRNSYGDPIDFGTCRDLKREDRRRDLEGGLEWRLHPRASLRLSASHIRRSSNCEDAQYEVNQAFFGVRFGWY